jgi:hypothetical protein
MRGANPSLGTFSGDVMWMVFKPMKKVLWIGTALLLSGGCGVVAAVAQQPAVAPKPSETKTPAPSRPVLELLSAGAAPRQILRYKPAVQSKQTATITMNMEMGMSIAGEPVPIGNLPGTAITFETLVDQVEPNGDIHYQFRYMNVDLVGSSTLPPAQRAQLLTQIQKLKGVRGTVVVDNRGQTKFGKFDLPPDLDNGDKKMLKQISNSVEQLSSPLPEPALGVGAKWRVLSAPKLNGIQLKQVTTFELVSVQAGSMTLNVAQEQQAAPQQMSTTQLPKGKTLNLKSLSGKGQGQLFVKLDHIVPINSNLSAQMQSEMESPNPPGEPMKMTTNIKMQLNLKSQ